LETNFQGLLEAEKSTQKDENAEFMQGGPICIDFRFISKPGCQNI